MIETIADPPLLPVKIGFVGIGLGLLATLPAPGVVTVVELGTTGTPVPTNDLSIAAAAGRAGALVVTTDRHFEWITRVGSVLA